MKIKITSISATLVIAPFFMQLAYSEPDKWESVWTEKTGNNWVTKQNTATGEKVSYNPQTAELWRNPNSGKTEAVVLENPLPFLSNGKRNPIPNAESKEWSERFDEKTGTAWQTYQNSQTGEVVSVNPFTSNVWRNPNTGKAEVVLEERIMEQQNLALEEANKILKQNEEARMARERAAKVLEEKSTQQEKWRAEREQQLARQQEQARQQQEQRRWEEQQRQYIPTGYSCNICGRWHENGMRCPYSGGHGHGH